jgi:tripartite-type tricarboxylate transporter receptor subunit TctC
MKTSLGLLAAVLSISISAVRARRARAKTKTLPTFEIRLSPWLVSALALLAPTAHAADAWPIKPVRMVVATTPGGGDDFVTRLIAPKLADILGQQFIVENRAGAGGLVGQVSVQKSPNDGYTWLLAGGSMAGTRLVNANATYDVLRDFTPVTQLEIAPFVLVIHPGVPAKNLKDYVALARSPNAHINFATLGGQMPYWNAMYFNSMAKIKATEIPYKSLGDALVDVMGGRVDYFVSPSAQYVANKAKLRALGITSAKRSPAFPEIPSIAEAGVPGYDLPAWRSIMGPAGVRRDIVDSLNGAIRKTLAMPEIRDKMLNVGSEPMPSSPEELSKRYSDWITIFTKVAKDAGLKPQ